MVTIPRLAAAHFVGTPRMWVPPAQSAFLVSCETLREVDDTHAALMDVDGTEFADAEAELGGAARAVRWCGGIDSQSDTDATMLDPDSPFEPLPPVRWAAEIGWSDFPNANTFLFQEVEHPHQLITLSSDSLQGSPRMLPWEVETFSSQFQICLYETFIIGTRQFGSC